MKIENYAWVLPRPSKSRYLGSFPPHFEKRLYELLQVPGDKQHVLHPFGGKAEFGFRCDLNPETKPDLICDAHKLSLEDNKFMCVVLDPPYSNEESEKIYGTGKLNFSKYVKEAVRVCRPGGYVVVYHKFVTPSLYKLGCQLICRIFLSVRTWHTLRCVHIHRKLG